MSEECVGKPCIVCKNTIQGANYHCPRCKACICFYCGAEMLKEVNVEHLICPRCGTKQVKCTFFLSIRLEYRKLEKRKR